MHSNNTFLHDEESQTSSHHECIFYYNWGNPSLENCIMKKLLVPFLVIIFSTHIAAQIKFETKIVDPEIDKVCYGLTVADVNGDKKMDLVGVSNRAVYWYENPSWKRHTMIEDQTIKDNVCIAPYDIDADGKIDFALGAGWTGTGTIQWLSRGKTLEEKWTVHKIGVIRWTHRMRFADVLGKGKAQLVVSPLNKTKGDGVLLTAYEIPTNPKKDRWKETVLSENLNRVHNHWHLDFDGDGTVDTVTASQEGISLIQKSDKGFKSRKLSAEAAGEVKFGKFVRGSRMFATIEPMHGTKAVAYAQINGKLNRMVLDDQLKQGHAVWIANLDSDAEDEIVIGHREAGTGKIKGPGLYVFDFDKSSSKWNKQVVDGGCAVEDALAVDFDGDGKIDLAAGGRATRNVKIYWNKGSK